MSEYRVAALYKFTTLDGFEDLQAPLLEVCNAERVTGTLLLAREGINGTIAGSDSGIEAVLNHIRSDPRLADLGYKDSWSDTPPFLRMKVRLKKEIVTMGVPDIDPVHSVGTYVTPDQWNELISDPDVIVVDTRNDYEVEIGTFKNAINPKTDSFREFPDWVQNSGILEENKKVAMFCTGGIRCEKSTAYLRQNGVKEVFHLHGGILKYLEEVKPENSLWDGECFVFDERVSVGHGLVPGPYKLCRACRNAISDQDMQSPHYEDGVSCPKCYDIKTDDQRKRYAERQKQMKLAKVRKEVHLGTVPR